MLETAPDRDANPPLETGFCDASRPSSFNAGTPSTTYSLFYHPPDPMSSNSSSQHPLSFPQADDTRPSLYDTLRSRFPKGMPAAPPMSSQEQLNAPFFGLGLVYQQTSARDTVDDETLPESASDDVPVDDKAVSNASFTSLRRWWTDSSKGHRSPQSIAFPSETSVNTTSTSTNAPLRPLTTTPSTPKKAISQSTWPRSALALPTIDGSPNPNERRKTASSLRGSIRSRKDDPVSPCRGDPFSASGDAGSYFEESDEDRDIEAQKLSKRRPTVFGLEWIDPAQWIKPKSTDADPGTEMSTAPWATTQILVTPPPAARGLDRISPLASDPSSSFKHLDTFGPMRGQVRRSFSASFSPSPPASLPSPSNHHAPLRPTHVRDTSARASRHAVYFSEDHRIQPRIQAEGSTNAARARNFASIANVSRGFGAAVRSTRRSFANFSGGDRTSTVSDASTPPRPRSVVDDPEIDGGIRASDHLVDTPTHAHILDSAPLPAKSCFNFLPARTLFWLGFIAPWCWLLGGWFLEQTSGDVRSSSYSLKDLEPGTVSSQAAVEMSAAPQVEKSLEDTQGSMVAPPKPASLPRLSSSRPQRSKQASLDPPAMKPLPDNSIPVLAIDVNREPADSPSSSDSVNESAGLSLGRLPATTASEYLPTSVPKLPSAAHHPSKPRLDPWVARCRLAAFVSGFMIFVACFVAIGVAVTAKHS